LTKASVTGLGAPPKKEMMMDKLSFIKTENGTTGSYINLAKVVAINFQPKQQDAQARLEFILVDHVTRTVFGAQAEALKDQIERLVFAV
jgi:hypothetical protein